MDYAEVCTEIPVCSLSRPVLPLLPRMAVRAQRLGVFARAVDLLVGENLLSLVTPELGNGPFHFVLAFLPPARLPAVFDWIPEVNGARLGPWRLRWSEAVIWEPRPAWENWHPLPGALSRLGDIARTAAWRRQAISLPSETVLGLECAPVMVLGRGLIGDRVALAEGAAALAGWGPGLTPAGDDFLAGVMLAIQIHPQGKAMGERIYAAAAPRTTRLSQAFLAAARDGLVDEAWQRLLAALESEDSGTLTAAAEAVLAFGASSGLDMLAGFLWGMAHL